MNGFDVGRRLKFNSCIMSTSTSVFVLLFAIFAYWLLCPVPSFPRDAADEMRGKTGSFLLESIGVILVIE
jgi:hypothetical protein